MTFSDGVIGAGVVLAVAVSSFLAGLVMGSHVAKKETKKWLDENGCYLCQEKFKSPLDDL